ncbi:CIC11C00000005657 [Sungouiella intermedia]|uniref:CIC11C00000005657 n=1 Tax=Sungouiella intermedia TaxID=45354 RepID=A0A1L0DH18_9ASCO|nr:CIC11C00000005657 [[Candida] intermedia]
MDWPEPLVGLFGKFRLINTHLTFLSSFSRHTIPTFDHLQKLNNDISMLDLAMIKFLLPPGDVSFEYVDENQVMLNEKVRFSWDRGYSQNQPKTVDDAYEAISRQEEPKHEKQLLIFEFTDIRTQGIGAIIKGKDVDNRKRQKREIKDNLFNTDYPDFFLETTKLTMDQLTQEQLQAIIKGRNNTFTACVEKFLLDFTQEDIDEGVPFKTLVESTVKTVPEPSHLSDPVDMMAVRQSDSVLTADKPEMEEMMNVLKEKPLFRDQILVSATLTAPRPAKLELLDHNLIHPDLVEALWQFKGIDAVDGGLYLHQAQALRAITDHKKHVIVSTSTSSGKSLIYQIPILNDILNDIDAGINGKCRTATAMFIFPTKALAQDQKRHLTELISHLPTKNRKITVDTYDGDTASKDRGRIRNHADIIFTNPDAIHAAILPNHNMDTSLEPRGWEEFLRNLKYVVMDELHVYKGTFGVHVSYVMTRLNRLISLLTYDTIPLYISCSATIKNPESHFRTVCAIPDSGVVEHIHEDGSPSTEKKLVVWEPPVLMNKKGQRNIPQKKLALATSVETTIKSPYLPRESIIGELAKILVHLLCKLPSIKVIVFCPIRQVCELLIKEVRSLIASHDHPEWTGLHEHDVMSYRGGYSKSDRRAIESKMFNGQLRAIVATNALELGIDLSDLDVVISCGFPGLKLNLHQQFGRAGRGKSSKGSLAILVCGGNPVDRFYLKNPHELCDKNSYEDLCVEGILDGSLNQLVMSMHLQCAAFEWPIDLEKDQKWFSPHGLPKMNAAFETLCKEKLNMDNRGTYRTDPRYLPWPSEKISLRAIELTNYAVVDITNNRNIVIEEVEELRTSFTLYEGGIFLHQGLPYLVKEFNPDEKYAKVERVKVTWITQQRDFSDVDPIEIELVKRLQPPNFEKPSDIPVFFGKIQTTIIVFGYFKVSRKLEILEAVEVKNPPVILKSKGLWLDIPTSAIRAIQEKKLSPAGGIHAAQHAIMNVLPIFITGGATTNPNVRYTSNLGDAELATECKAPEKEFAQRQSKRKRPARLIFYDAKGGERGTGISAKTFEFIDDIVYTTYQRVLGCECEWGCPLCVSGSFCKENMLVMSKPAAIIILGTLLGYPVEELKEQVLDGPEENMPPLKVETITEEGRTVKFAPDVEIVEVRKATFPVSNIKKEDTSD